MKFTIAAITTLAATATAMAPREEPTTTTECCATVQAKAYLGSQCSGLALLDFEAPTTGICTLFYTSEPEPESDKPVHNYYTKASCTDGIYTADIWVDDAECTAAAGVYPLEQGLECSTEEVTTGINAALQLTCVE